MELFDKIFNGEARPNDEKSVDGLRGWLKREYDVQVKDRNVLTAMLSLHDAGEESQHFAHPEVSSAFGRGVLQLAKLPDGWHVVFRQPHHSEHMVLHPKSEASYSHPVNRKAVSELRTLLKSATLVDELPSVQVPAAAEQFIKEPTALIDGSNVHLVIPDEVVDDVESLPAVPESYGVDGLLGSGFSSMSIDLGSFDSDSK